jgi:DNA-binding NtrC family response regulator/tetratricopeptide (TPR) repeat protein
MRGVSRRGSDSAGVSLRNFAWPAAAVATLRHSTLPFPSLSASHTPLADLRNLGARDRLSLVGQFAAHIAFLQFAGIAAGDFDPGEWVVVRKRGADCRLLRAGARASDAAPLALHSIQQFAEAIEAPPLEVLRQSWTRAESIYAEVRRRLRDDAAADLQWLLRSAVGEILPPGPETLAVMWEDGGPHVVSDATAFRAMAMLDSSAQLVVIGTEFPIQRYGALASVDSTLPGSHLAPAAVADRSMELFASTKHVVIVCGKLDEDSRRVVDILRSGREVSEVAATRRWMAISTRIAAQRALEERLGAIADPRRWLDEFLASDGFEAFVDEGAIPVDDGGFATTQEPRRSYIAALALLGTQVPLALARDFLRQFLYEQPLDDLVIAGVTSIDADSFRFASDAVRVYCARHIPAASRDALCRAAAAVADPVRAGLLLIDCGEVQRGTEVLEAATWSRTTDVAASLSTLPRSALSPRLAARLAFALVDNGRYADARDLAPLLGDDNRELLLARCERRTGDYSAAISRLDRLKSSAFDAQILRLELLRLAGRIDEARRISVQPANEEDKARIAYEHALLDLEARSERVDAQHYFGKRLATYRALLDGDFDRAADLAAQSVAAARCASERIDAELDRVFASFSAGHWSETRAIALEALTSVDEAQGDRAAAGILFTLTFVEIDDGRWATAAQHVQRLRQYYSTMHDDHRLSEIDLLSGYLDFSRGHFGDARRHADALLRSDQSAQIREAVALMADEIDWIERKPSPLRSTGKSHNRELDDRHRLMCARRGLNADAFVNEFMRTLAAWEKQPASSPSSPADRSEKLKLFRSALGTRRDDIAREMATELSIDMPAAAGVHTGLDIETLRLAASAEYPFRAQTFPLPWCHATRNRLGHWSQDGSCVFDAATLDRVAQDREIDWLRCDDRELLYMEGCGSWPQASRDAIAAVFRTRAENHRLRRLIEQDNPPATAHPDRVEGIVGESSAMRSVFTLVEKIAPRDVPVCVLGESGTGKELIGRAIHRGSPRRIRTFTAINCAALPENLVESELFGHMRGAFTGADRDRAGVIETTDGGTLFLDEIGEMPMTAQAKLLRFLQDGEFRRLGETANRTADVRIVSATNRKLETAVEEGRFREDLYYRIRGVDIVLPPLRDRGSDVMLIAHHFLARERTRHRSGPQAFTSEVESLLQSYGWPGNVRELQNTIRAAHAIAGEAREIDIEHLPERLRNVKPARTLAGSYQDEVARFRRDLIEKSLLAASGNQNQAAALLKISRQALAYQIRELGIMVGKAPSRPRV